MVRVKVVDYEPDRIWSAMRKEHLINVDDMLSRTQLQTRLDDAFSKDKYLRNLGSIGRQQISEKALVEFGRIAPQTRLDNLMVLRERGLLTAGEFYDLAEQQGHSRRTAEKEYRRFSGSEEAVWQLKEKKLLRYGEYSQLIRAKGLTRGQGFYRYRKWQAREGIRPFRKIKASPKKSLL